MVKVFVAAELLQMSTFPAVHTQLNECTCMHPATHSCYLQPMGIPIGVLNRKGIAAMRIQRAQPARYMSTQSMTSTDTLSLVRAR